MDEKILLFLREKKYGAYKMIVNHFKDDIKNLSIVRAFDYINLVLKSDFEKHGISLKYNSFRDQYNKVFKIKNTENAAIKTEGEKLTAALSMSSFIVKNQNANESYDNIPVPKNELIKNATLALDSILNSDIPLSKKEENKHVNKFLKNK